MLLSIVIPVYNRCDTIVPAINSVFECFGTLSQSLEIIVVDDCSTDGSLDLVQAQYPQQVLNGKLILFRLNRNMGVGGARNAGVEKSHGKWVLFFDSDDKLIPGMGEAIRSQLHRAELHPVVFFRCLNEQGERVGTAFSDAERFIALREFLRRGSYGECLVAIQRNCAIAQPFVEDLRGYEGLTVARILKQTRASAILSPITARIYDQSGDDRLSSRLSFLRRMPLIARGHLTMAKEFWSDMSPSLTFKYISKALIYLCCGTLHKITPRG